MSHHSLISLKKVQRAARLVHEQLGNNKDSVDAATLGENDHTVGIKAEDLEIVSKVQELLAANPSLGYRKLYEHLKRESANAYGMPCSHDVDDEPCDDAVSACLADMQDFYDYSTDVESDTDDGNMDSDVAPSPSTSPAPVPNLTVRPPVMSIQKTNSGPVEEWKVKQGLVARPAAEQFAMYTPRIDQSFDIFTPRP